MAMAVVEPAHASSSSTTQDFTSRAVSRGSLQGGGSALPATVNARAKLSLHARVQLSCMGWYAMGCLRHALHAWTAAQLLPQLLMLLLHRQTRKHLLHVPCVLLLCQCTIIIHCQVGMGQHIQECWQARVLAGVVGQQEAMMMMISHCYHS